MKTTVEASSRTWNMGTEYGEYTAVINISGKKFSFAGNYTLPEDGSADVSVSMHTEKGWIYVYNRLIEKSIAEEIEGYRVV